MHRHSQSPPMSQPHASRTHLRLEKKKQQSKIHETSDFQTRVILFHEVIDGHRGVTFLEQRSLELAALHHRPHLAVRVKSASVLFAMRSVINETRCFLLLKKRRFTI